MNDDPPTLAPSAAAMAAAEAVLQADNDSIPGITTRDAGLIIDTAFAPVVEALRRLTETIEAHEIESLDCDRRGDIYCECLRNETVKARAALADATGNEERPK